MDSVLAGLAQAHLDRHCPAGASISSVATAELRWDEGYCRRVAEYFDSAPSRDLGVALTRRYDAFKQENLRHYRLLSEAGITVRPWPVSGQPYRTSAELRASVRATGVLYVYLTSAGHGPGPAGGEHPMLAGSGIVVDGVELCHNDVFRVVHDVFGHVMSGHGFSPRGEFRASYCHLRMYPESVHPVLFTEQIAQICWFFYGPRAAERRYPEQKVFAFPRRYLDEFRSLFTPI